VGRPKGNGVVRLPRRTEDLVRRVLGASQWLTKVMENRQAEIESPAYSVGIDYQKISVQGGVAMHKAQSIVERLESDPVYTAAQDLRGMFRAGWSRVKPRDQQIITEAVWNGYAGLQDLAKRLGLRSAMGALHAKRRALAVFWHGCLDGVWPDEADASTHNNSPAFQAWMRAWAEKKLDALEDYLYRLALVRDDRVFTVSGSLGGHPARGKPAVLYMTRGSSSFGDTPKWLTGLDVGRTIEVRVPWGYAHIGGCVFPATVLKVTEDQVLFEATTHVGDMGHGRKVYTMPRMRFSINRNLVMIPGKLPNWQ